MVVWKKTIFDTALDPGTDTGAVSYGFDVAAHMLAFSMGVYSAVRTGDVTLVAWNGLWARNSLEDPMSTFHAVKCVLAHGNKPLNCSWWGGELLGRVEAKVYANYGLGDSEPRA